MSTPGSQAGGHHCPCPQLDQFCEHVQRSGWSQTTDLLDHMDRCHHWLKDVRARAATVQRSEMCFVQQTSSGLFQQIMDSHQLSTLLELCPEGSVQQGLKGLLLLASIRHGLADLTLDILQRGSVSDSLVMEAIKFAVHLKAEGLFLQMFQSCSRSRRVFRQKFVHQQWKEDEECEYYSQFGWQNGNEVTWMYFTLYNAGEKDLALFVAGNSPHYEYDELIVEFCKSETTQFNLKRRMYRYALRKLYERNGSIVNVINLYRDQSRSRHDRSIIFREAVRLQEHSTLSVLCEHGVSQADLKFLTSWYLFENGDLEHFVTICAYLKGQERDWLCRYGIKYAKKEYFKDKSKNTLKIFTERFSTNSNMPIFSLFFRMAISEHLKRNNVYGFAQLCNKRSKFDESSMINTKQEDLHFAFTSAIDKSHFISEVCREMAVSDQDEALKESLLLLDIIVMKKVWKVLPVLQSGLPSYSHGKLSKLLEKCVHKMLSDQSTWPGMAPALNQWIKMRNMTFAKPEVDTVKTVLLEEHWPCSVSSLKQWCVDSGHVYLAFFLALVTADWTLVEAVVSSLPSLEVRLNTFMEAVKLAAASASSSTCITLLKAFPVNGEVIGGYNPFPESDRLSKACEEQGLIDWAIVLQCHNLDYIKEHLHSYHNQTVLDAILRKMVSFCHFHSKWDIARELLTRCTESKMLKLVLRAAIFHGQEDIAKALIICVDLVTCIENRTMLIDTAVRSSPDQMKMKMVSLCVASGASTFERDVIDADPRDCRSLLLALESALENGHSDVLKAVLESGTFSYKSLYWIANDKESQFRLTSASQETEGWKKGYRDICKAAATPCRLEHMARLVVSHNLGCQPGRAARINSLPLPTVTKDMMRFKDILEP